MLTQSEEQTNEIVPIVWYDRLNRIQAGIEEIEKRLLQPKDRRAFLLGKGYIQHELVDMHVAHVILQRMIAEYHNTKLLIYDARMARFLLEHKSPLYATYYRVIACLKGSTLREYANPVYAWAPEMVADVKLETLPRSQDKVVS